MLVETETQTGFPRAAAVKQHLKKYIDGITKCCEEKAGSYF